MSPAADTFRETAIPCEDDEDDFPPPDSSQPGDLAITPELISAFVGALLRYGVDICLFSGSWENFDYTGEKYDVVLTSETIYRLESLPPLLDIMWRGCTEGSKTLEERSRELNIASDQGASGKSGYLCLVAAKLVYFGVGGGVTEFVDAVEAPQRSGCNRRPGKIGTVWKNTEGVQRIIMKVHWK